MNRKEALEELVKILEELVEDRRSQQHPVDCDVDEEQEQRQEEMECQPGA
jgi:hypothetical protein